MPISEIRTEDLIRAVVAHGRDNSCCPVRSACDLKIVNKVSYEADWGGSGPQVDTEAYLSVTVTDTENHRSEIFWQVTLAEALSYLAKGVTVTF